MDRKDRKGARGRVWWFLLVLFIRIYMGEGWVHAGIPKIFYDPTWTPQTVLAFVSKGADKTHALSRTWVPQDWGAYDGYNWYIRTAIINTGAYRWLPDLIAWGEVLIGLSWIFGFAVWPSAMFGLVLTVHLGFADSVRTNLVFFAASIILMYEGRWGGYWGLDRVILPRLTKYLKRLIRPEAQYALRP